MGREQPLVVGCDRPEAVIGQNLGPSMFVQFTGS